MMEIIKYLRQSLENTWGEFEELFMLLVLLVFVGGVLTLSAFMLSLISLYVGGYVSSLFKIIYPFFEGVVKDGIIPFLKEVKRDIAALFKRKATKRKKKAVFYKRWFKYMLKEGETKLMGYIFVKKETDEGTVLSIYKKTRNSVRNNEHWEGWKVSDRKLITEF